MPSSVADDLGRGSCKYIGTAVGIDNCVYGMPCYTNRIVKYDPMNDITAFFREGAGDSFSCRGDVFWGGIAVSMYSEEVSEY